MVFFTNLRYSKPSRMKKIITLSIVLFSLSVNAQPASFSPRGIGGGGALFSLSLHPPHNSEHDANFGPGG